MRRPSLRPIPLLAALALLLPAALGAQAAAPMPYFSVQGGLMQSGFTSDDLEDEFDAEFDAGLGFFALGSWHRGPLSLGVGIQRTTHGIEDVSEDLAVLSVFGEPRWQFAMAGAPRIAPYVAGRLGYTMASVELEDAGESFDVETNGLMFGLGAGAVFAMTPAVALDAGVHWNSIGYGDIEVESETLDGTDGRATQLGFRVGLSFRFGAR